MVQAFGARACMMTRQVRIVLGLVSISYVIDNFKHLGWLIALGSTHGR
jgi:hypothetical protein